MKHIYTGLGYIFAAVMFTLAIPLIVVYSMHLIAIKVSNMVTRELR